MRAFLMGLGLLVVIAGAAAPACAQGYYDRLYRGASPDPTDNRYDAGASQDGRDDSGRAARARRNADEEEPKFNAPRANKDDKDDNDDCDSRRSARAGDRGC
jgi:hypothetical protein